ncbi:MAG: alpha/beta hydrolase, partial [Coxiella sp. (in: Bacteria)]
MANFKPLLGSIFRYIIFGAASYLIVCGLVYFFSDDSIFLPPKQHYKTLPGLHYIDTSAGKIATVYLSNPKAKFTLLYSQGNASDLGYSYRLLQLTAQKGYNVFAYDYNGYGMSEGKPSEKNTYLDIDAAYRYLRDVKHVPANRIIIMAHSLGTGVAVELATHVKAAGLILESPYLSIYRTQT